MDQTGLQQFQVQVSHVVSRVQFFQSDWDIASFAVFFIFIVNVIYLYMVSEDSTGIWLLLNLNCANYLTLEDRPTGYDVQREPHLVLELLTELQRDGEEHQRVVQPRHHALHLVDVAHLKAVVVELAVDDITAGGQLRQRHGGRGGEAVPCSGQLKHHSIHELQQEQRHH
ncbi:hypothetical protein FQN60_004453 [Etheostoma spectabile]|uniref:Uncharacterized protein n=1 Tax=Etheostoma spectabile TaxID=54343 RepID=A0A5J5CX80_9PERO|nr:hypothetical protein FQN60_004453 [Etheostoma spectabile]